MLRFKNPMQDLTSKQQRLSALEDYLEKLEGKQYDAYGNLADNTIDEIKLCVSCEYDGHGNPIKGTDSFQFNSKHWKLCKNRDEVKSKRYLFINDSNSELVYFDPMSTAAKKICKLLPDECNGALDSLGPCDNHWIDLLF